MTSRLNNAVDSPMLLAGIEESLPAETGGQAL
jgi:hypothetical protein